MDRADDKDWAGMSRLQIRVILICIAINMLDGFDILAIAFTAPAIAKEWSLNPEALGGLLSAGLAGMVAGSFLLGPLADRFGRRPIILFGLIIAILGMGGAALSQDLTQLALVRAITGFAVGGMLPCINTMVAEYASPKARTFSVAMLQAGFSTGASLGGFSAVWILASAGWQAVFLAGAVLTAILLPLVWFGMPESLAYLESRPDRAEEAAKIRSALGEVAPTQAATDNGGNVTAIFGQLRGVAAPLALSSALFFFCIMSFYFINSWTPKILVDSGLSESAGVSGGALLTLGGIIAALLLGWMSLRRSVLPLIAAFAIASAVLTALFGQMGGALAPAMIAAFALCTATSATQIGIYAIFPSLFPSAIRAGATGVGIGVGRLGSVLGPWLAGLLLAKGWGIEGLFMLMALPYLIGTILIISLRRYQLH